MIPPYNNSPWWYLPNIIPWCCRLIMPLDDAYSLIMSFYGIPKNVPWCCPLIMSLHNILYNALNKNTLNNLHKKNPKALVPWLSYLTSSVDSLGQCQSLHFLIVRLENTLQLHFPNSTFTDWSKSIFAVIPRPNCDPKK